MSLKCWFCKIKEKDNKRIIDQKIVSARIAIRKAESFIREVYKEQSLDQNELRLAQHALVEATNRLYNIMTVRLGGYKIVDLHTGEPIEANLGNRIGLNLPNPPNPRRLKDSP